MSNQHLSQPEKMSTDGSMPNSFRGNDPVLILYSYRLMNCLMIFANFLSISDYGISFLFVARISMKFYVLVYDMSGNK